MNRSEAIAGVREQIAAACRDAGRDPASVTLVAVSKTFGAEAIEPVIAAGQRVFGENRVQEAKAKWPALTRRASRTSSCISSARCNRTRPRRRWRCSTPSIRSTGRASREALAKEIARQGRQPAAVRRDQYRRRAAEGRRAAGGRRRFPRRLPRHLWARDRRADVHPAGRRAAGAAFRAHRQDRQPQRAEAPVDGHERRFRDRDRVRRHPCAGRHRDFRRARLEAARTESVDSTSSDPMRPSRRREVAARRSATQPAVGAKPGRATWMNTALPRPAMRGRVLWSISTMKS